MGIMALAGFKSEPEMLCDALLSIVVPAVTEKRDLEVCCPFQAFSRISTSPHGRRSFSLSRAGMEAAAGLDKRRGGAAGCAHAKQESGGNP